MNPFSLVQTYGLEHAKHLLESNQVIIGSADFPVEWRLTDEQFREGLPNLVAMAQASAALNVDKCCTYILPSTDQPAATFMSAATKRLRLCADILEAYGIRLGLSLSGVIICVRNGRIRFYGV